MESGGLYAIPYFFVDGEKVFDPINRLVKLIRALRSSPECRRSASGVSVVLTVLEVSLIGLFGAWRGVLPVHEVRVWISTSTADFRLDVLRSVGVAGRRFLARCIDLRATRQCSRGSSEPSGALTMSIRLDRALHQVFPAPRRGARQSPKMRDQ